MSNPTSDKFSQRWGDYLQARRQCILQLVLEGKTSTDILTTLNLKDEAQVTRIVNANHAILELMKEEQQLLK